MILTLNMTDYEMKETCNNCFFYYDCHKNGFDLEIAKDCDNIKYMEIDDDIVEQNYKVICETLYEKL